MNAPPPALEQCRLFAGAGPLMVPLLLALRRAPLAARIPALRDLHALLTAGPHATTAANRAALGSQARAPLPRRPRALLTH